MPTRLHLNQLLAAIIMVLSLAAGLIVGFAIRWLAQEAQLPIWADDLCVAIGVFVAFFLTFAGLRLERDAKASPFERTQQAERERQTPLGRVLDSVLLPDCHWEKAVLALLSSALHFIWPVLLLGWLGQVAPVPSHEIPKALLFGLPWLAGLSAALLFGTMVAKAASSSLDAWRRLAILWGALYVSVRFLGDAMQELITGFPTFSALAASSLLITGLFVHFSARRLQYHDLYIPAEVTFGALRDFPMSSLVRLARQEAARLLLFALKSKWEVHSHMLSADPRARRWYDQTRTINQEELEWRVLLHLIGSLQVTTQDQDPDDMDTEHERYHDQRYRHLTSLLIASRTGYSPVTDPETGQIILPAVPDCQALRHHHESILRPFLTANADLHQQLTHALLHTPNVSQRQLIELLNQVIITAGLPTVMYGPLGTNDITHPAASAAEHSAHDQTIPSPRLN